MKKLVILLSICAVVVSCTKIPDKLSGSFLTGRGVFILNEGNFTWGNGSISFYSYDSSKIYNNLFFNINGRPLGDVPNAMGINGEIAYIVVNNSGKIEVVSSSTLESISTINGLISPRNIAIVDNRKAYVTSIYSDSVTIVDLPDNVISGYINLRRSSESIVISGNRAFISNWLGGSEVMVVNTDNNEVIDSIEVGVEPESMVIDKNNMLWVLCNGGWARENFAELLAINTSSNQIAKKMEFPSKLASPSCLRIDAAGETLYFLESGLKRMNIDDDVLPSDPLIAESDHCYYKIGISPFNNDIFITDAVDYQQQGYVLYFNNNGVYISEQKADIIPGFTCFKL